MVKVNNCSLPGIASSQSQIFQGVAHGSNSDLSSSSNSLDSCLPECTFSAASLSHKPRQHCGYKSDYVRLRDEGLIDGGCYTGRTLL